MTDRTRTIETAAAWLAKTPDTHRPHPLIPHLQIEYGLTVQEAIAAIREANLKRARAL